MIELLLITVIFFTVHLLSLIKREKGQSIMKPIGLIILESIYPNILYLKKLKSMIVTMLLDISAWVHKNKNLEWDTTDSENIQKHAKKIVEFFEQINENPLFSAFFDDRKNIGLLFFISSLAQLQTKTHDEIKNSVKEAIESYPELYVRENFGVIGYEILKKLLNLDNKHLYTFFFEICFDTKTFYEMASLIPNLCLSRLPDPIEKRIYNFINFLYDHRYQNKSREIYNKIKQTDLLDEDPVFEAYRKMCVITTIEQVLCSYRDEIIENIHYLNEIEKYVNETPLVKRFKNWWLNAKKFIYAKNIKEKYFKPGELDMGRAVFHIVINDPTDIDYILKAFEIYEKNKNKIDGFFDLEELLEFREQLSENSSYK